jgi:hypothetical protein
MEAQDRNVESLLNFQNVIRLFKTIRGIVKNVKECKPYDASCYLLEEVNRIFGEGIAFGMKSERYEDNHSLFAFFDVMTLFVGSECANEYNAQTQEYKVELVNLPIEYLEMFRYYQLLEKILGASSLYDLEQIFFPQSKKSKLALRVFRLLGLRSVEKLGGLEEASQCAVDDIWEIILSLQRLGLVRIIFPGRGSFLRFCHKPLEMEFEMTMYGFDFAQRKRLLEHKPAEIVTLF